MSTNVLMMVWSLIFFLFHVHIRIKHPYRRQAHILFRVTNSTIDISKCTSMCNINWMNLKGAKCLILFDQTSYGNPYTIYIHNTSHSIHITYNILSSMPLLDVKWQCMNSIRTDAHQLKYANIKRFNVPWKDVKWNYLLNGWNIGFFKDLFTTKCTQISYRWMPFCYSYLFAQECGWQSFVYVILNILKQCVKLVHRAFMICWSISSVFEDLPFVHSSGNFDLLKYNLEIINKRHTWVLRLNVHEWKLINEATLITKIENGNLFLRIC